MDANYAQLVFLIRFHALKSSVLYPPAKMVRFSKIKSIPSDADSAQDAFLSRRESTASAPLITVQSALTVLPTVTLAEHVALVLVNSLQASALPRERAAFVP